MRLRCICKSFMNNTRKTTKYQVLLLSNGDKILQTKIIRCSREVLSCFIRRPFYAEIHRDIPVDIFNALFEAIKLSDDEDFREPFCYVKGNSKGKIITFTTKTLVIKMFCLLSDRSENYVNGLLERQLGGQRKGFTRKILVSYDKDFALVYNFKKGQLSLQFHYGKWNACGFPMHSCKVHFADN